MRSAALAGSLGILMFLRAGMALAQAAPLKPGTRTISVSGHGEIKAKPDLMIVSLSVDSKARSGAKCTELLTGKTQKLVDAIKALLGGNAKIETSDYSLSPVYEPDATPAVQTQPAEPERPPSIWTYNVSITVTADTIAALAPLIDVAMAVGPTVRVDGSGYRSQGEFGPNAMFDYHGPLVARTRPQLAPERQLSRPRPFILFAANATSATPDEAIKQGMQLADKLEKTLKAKMGTAGEVVVSVPQFWITQAQQPYQRQMVEPTPVPQHQIYAGHAMVTVKTEKLDSLGALIETGMKAGATQLNSASFTLSDEATSDNAAIAAASKEAATKAGTAANSMNVKLGKILNISVNVHVQPQTIYGAALQGAVGAAPANSFQRAILPVLPRQVGVGAEVNVLYEIE
jgi:uncharacterized protein YggE